MVFELGAMKRIVGRDNILAFYREDAADEYQAMHAQLAGLGLDAVEEVRRRIEEEGDKVSLSSLLDIIKTTADRTGNGPSSSVRKEVNIHVGLADRMAEARKRAKIEATARDITPREAAE